MPFSASKMTEYILAKASQSKMGGQKMQPMISAVSSAVCSYLPKAAEVSSTNLVLGPGNGTYRGTLTGCSPSTMGSLMASKGQSQGLSSQEIKKFFNAISFGVCQILSGSVTAQGNVIGGGKGSGQGKITSLSQSELQQRILSFLKGKKFLGGKTEALASAISFGICNHIMGDIKVLTTCTGYINNWGGRSYRSVPGPGHLV